MLTLQPFQKRFLKAALHPDIDIAAASLTRGSGKTTLAADVIQRAMTPGDKLFQSGREIVLCAVSLDQAGRCFKMVENELKPRGGYSITNTSTRKSITHRESGTRLNVLSSNGKSGMGLVGTSLAIADEPGSWEVNGGWLMWQALVGALGKPESPLKILVIGTLAPSTGGWWHDLIHAGTHGRTHVLAMQADPAKWDSWKEIMRVNPLAKLDPTTRAVIRQQLKEAKTDTAKKAFFLSYRLNLPTPDEAKQLITPSDWQRVLKRTVPEREGRPIVGLDIGAGRAWSAAVGLWPNGRCESLALTPGLPDIAAQEQRDRVARGVYQKLVDVGRLHVATGLRVQPVKQLLDAITAEWGIPKVIVCDRFEINRVLDEAKGIRIEPRVTRWSEATADIAALRKMVLDGPLACEPDSGMLLTASLAVAVVVSDDQGSVRLTKGSPNNTGRDDCAVALTLAAGAMERYGHVKELTFLGY